MAYFHFCSFIIFFIFTHFFFSYSSFSSSESSAPPPQTPISPVSPGGPITPSPNTRPGGLTDEEKKIAETYQHKGLTEKIYNEKCRKPSGVEGKLGPIDPFCEGKTYSGLESAPIPEEIISTLKQAYSFIIGANPLSILQGGGVNSSQLASMQQKADAAKSATSSATNASKSTADQIFEYCGLIAAATEGIVLLKQQFDNASLSNLKQKSAGSPLGEQKVALYHTAISHENRYHNSIIQSVGWTTTFACFVAKTVINGLSGTFDWKDIVKAAGAAILAGFSIEQSVRSLYARDKVMGVAKALPSPGDCNPVTETACFCTEKTSLGDPDYTKYCVLNKASDDPTKNGGTHACINDAFKIDPECNCRKTNSCFEEKYSQFFLGGGGNNPLANSIKANVGQIMRGETLGSGNLKSLSEGKMATQLRESQDLFNSKHKDPSPPKELQEPLKGFSEKLGIQSPLNRYLASNSPLPVANSEAGDSFSKNFSSGDLSGDMLSQTQRNPSSNNDDSQKVLQFQGGDGLSALGQKDSLGAYASTTTGPSLPEDLLNALGSNNKKEQEGNGKVLSFHDKAVEQQNLTHQKEKNLFEIISYRYFYNKQRLENKK